MNFISGLFGGAAGEDANGGDTSASAEATDTAVLNQAAILRSKRLKKLEQRMKEAEVNDVNEDVSATDEKQDSSATPSTSAAPPAQDAQATPPQDVQAGLALSDSPIASLPTRRASSCPTNYSAAETTIEKPETERRATSLSNTTPKRKRVVMDDDAILKSVFQISVDEKSTNDKFIFLEEVAETLREDDGTVRKLTTENIDQILYGRLSITPCVVSPLKYLASCYSRVLAEERRSSRQDGTMRDVLEQSKTYLVNFSGTVINAPEIFPSPKPSSVTGNSTPSMVTEALFGSDDYNATFELISLVMKSSAVVDDEDVKVGIFESLFADALSGLSSLSGTSTSNIAVFPQQAPLTAAILQPFSSTIGRLQQLVRLPGAVDVLWKLPQFSLRVNGQLINGQQMEMRTLLGTILSMGTCGGTPMMIGGGGFGRVEMAVAKQYFANPTRRSLQDIQSSMSTLRVQLAAVVDAAQDIIHRLLKGPSASKLAVQTWIGEALMLSRGRMKDRPNPLTEVHDSFALNFSSTLFKLSEPFTRLKPGMGWPKIKLVDSKYLCCPEMKAIYGDENGRVIGCGAPTGNDEGNGKSDPGLAASSFNFVTRCFFFAARSQHLGLVVAARNASLFERYMSHAHRTGNMAQFDQMLGVKFARDAQSHDPAFALRSLDFITFSARWLHSTLCCSGDADGTLNYDIHLPKKPRPGVSYLPVSMVEDIADVLSFIVQIEPMTISAATDKMNVLLSFISAVLKGGEPYFNIHLRAKFGDVLLFAFVPPDHRGLFQHTQHSQFAGKSFNASGTAGLLATNTLALNSLAPSLLALYGDVEHTGPMEANDHRLKISAVLKYLWTFEGHREAVRKAATLDGREEKENNFSFLTFANGILNETNSAVSNSLGKLQSIKEVQEAMKDVSAWLAKPEVERKPIEEKLAEDEQYVGSYLRMANETMDMLAYLSAEIKSPFLAPELLGRLGSTLNSIMVKLAGRGGLNLKVDNPEKYHFRPKVMLVQIIKVYLNMGGEEEFIEEVAKEFAEDFYEENVLHKAGSILRKHNLMDPTELDEWNSVVAKIIEQVSLARENGQFVDDVPDEFTCPLLMDIMRNPVKLADKGPIVDLNSIKQHLLNSGKNPYTGEDLTVEELIPVPELKARIDAWVAEQREKVRAGSHPAGGN
jgi:ubiquitin conjugation factor E4 B